MQNHMPDFFNITWSPHRDRCTEKIFVANLGSGAGNSAAAVYRLTVLFHNRIGFPVFFLTLI
jgi:hypothetical protein